MKQIDSLLKGSFARSVAILASGTALGQLIGVIFLPFLTRIYTPADFAVLSVFISLLIVLSDFASLGFNIAIAVPTEERKSRGLLILACSSALFVTGVLLVPTLMFPTEIAYLLNKPALSDTIWLLPPGVLAVAWYSSGTFWATRNKAFKLTAKTKIIQSSAMVTCQTLLGLMGFGSVGLMAGHVIGNSLGAFRLILLGGIRELIDFKLSEIKTIAKEFKKFPQFTSFEILTNSATVQVPILLISHYENSYETGFILLAMRVMQMPMSFLGNAISQVYLSEAPSKKLAGELASLTLNVVTQLMKLGVLPIVFVGVIAPEFFALIFGKEWARAGIIVSWMTPWFAFQFLSSPISMVTHVVGRQRSKFIIMFLGLLLRVLPIYLLGTNQHSGLVESYAITGFVLYFSCTIFYLRWAGLELIESLSLIGKKLHWVLGTILVGLVVKYLLIFFS